jgi:hypothetical protein
MIRKLDFRVSALLTLGILGAVSLFHVLILTEVIPFTIVWGGRLKDLAQMRVFETVSLGINALMLWMIAMRGGYAKLRVPQKVVTIFLWVVAGVFMLNTIGNVLSHDTFEKFFFTPVTLLLAILCTRLAIEK